MPLALIAIAAVALFALMRHPADPKGSLVSDIKSGHDYILFVYTQPGLDQQSVTLHIANLFQGKMTIAAIPQLMGTGPIPNTTIMAESWAVPIKATANMNAVDIDKALTDTDTYHYQALQAA